MNEDYYMVNEKNNADALLDVTFYKEYPKHSDGLGGQIIGDEEIDHIKIVIPGDDTLVIREEVEERHKRRFPAHWAAYNNLQQATGTPIDELPTISNGEKAELIKHGFRYIEQVAMMPDNFSAKIMGSIAWKRKALEFLDNGKVDKDSVIAEQGEKIAELQAKMDILMDHINEKVKSK